MAFVISSNSLTTTISPKHNKIPQFQNPKFIQNPRNLFRLNVTNESSDCNTEECAPDKEVGKLNMGWVAEENTKVIGTFPPRTTRGFTGYVEKDTAGQTNIYSVEPVVYVAESVLSSGAAGSSADGSENTAAIAFLLGLIALAASSSILLQVGKKPAPVVESVDYSGPSLSYYINKFKATEVIAAASSAVETETLTSSAADIPEASEVIPETSESTATTEVTTDIPEASATVLQDQVEIVSEPEVSAPSQ